MKNSSSLKKNNKGLSLVEMIIVIAIMAVMVGMVSVGFGMVSTRPVTQCAQNMEICLNRCRTHTMGKTNGFVAFYAETDGSVYMVEKLGFSNYDLNDSSDCGAVNYTKRLIGKKGVEVSCGTFDLIANHGTDNAIIFEFDRSDGSLKACGTLNSDDGSINSKPAEIIVKKGTRKTYTIEVQKLTGKVVLTKG